MSSLLDFPALVQPEAIRVVRDPQPIRIDEPERDQALWLEGLVAYHDSQAQESATDPLGVHELLCERLGVLARTLHGQMPSGIAVHDTQEGPVPKWWMVEIDRRLAGKPAGRMVRSILARCVLDELALLFPYNTAAKRLVVRRLLALASDCEAFGALDAWTFARDFDQAKTQAIASLCAGGW